MKIQRTDDPNIDYVYTEGVALWVHNIVRFKIDRSNRQFILTSNMRDGSYGPKIDCTDLVEKFERDRR